jgi:three-Cys-motif partner protein
MNPARRRRGEPDPRQVELPEMPPRGPEGPRPQKRLRHALWTGYKAKLIARYLQLFVMITKHGTYIDGFAGPQQMDQDDMWAAKLVLDNRPPLLRNVHLCEVTKKKIRALEELKARQSTIHKGKKFKREITIHPGDFNVNVSPILAKLKDRAIFALLDQHTFECQWRTAKAIAQADKKGSNKIEIFYFLATSWMGRALKAARREATMQQIKHWWGRSDWQEVSGWTIEKLKDEMAERFRSELGYKDVRPYPIMEAPGGGGRIMYYMIHATDHLDAPELMTRAYNTALRRQLAQQRRLFE